MNLYAYVSDPLSYIDPLGLNTKLSGCELEQQVTDWLDSEGIEHIDGEQFGPNGSIGEIDVRVTSPANAIIEVTSKPKGKLSQIEKLMNNETINPDKLPVILYAPNYKVNPGKDVTNIGAIVVRDLDSLILTLRSL